MVLAAVVAVAMWLAESSHVCEFANSIPETSKLFNGESAVLL